MTEFTSCPQEEGNNKPAPFCPIIFFGDKPSGQSLENKSALSEIPPIPTNESCEDGYTPSFCRTPAPVAVEPPKPVSPQNALLIPQVPLPYTCKEPIPAALSIIQPDQAIMPNHSQPQKESKAVAAPRAYNVAMELMQVQPLRMVGNALYAFDGQVYRFVSASAMNRLIMHLCRAYVHAVGDASIIKRIYEVIQAEPGIVYAPENESVPFVAVDDGLLNLVDFSIGSYSPQPFVTVRLHGSYTQGQLSACPVFDSFIHSISGGDTVLVERIWQAIGYAIVPDTNGKCFILLQGVPDSGKSLLGDIIASLIDPDLVTSLDINTMGERFGPSELVGKQLCLALDMPSGKLDAKATSTFKQLTGGDFVTADVKYQPRIRFKCSATFVLASNHPLLTHDPDPAFLQRAVVIPFHYSVGKSRQDRSLKARILTERNAILYRAIQAYARLRQANYQFAGDFVPNEAILGQASLSNSLTDALYDFCCQHCLPVDEEFTPTSKLYQAFCDTVGATWPGEMRCFSDEAFRILCRLFPQQVKRDRKRPKGTSLNAERGFSGIQLR